MKFKIYARAAIGLATGMLIVATGCVDLESRDDIVNILQGTHRDRNQPGTPADPTPPPQNLIDVSGCWQIDQSNNNSGYLSLTQTGTAISGRSNWTTHSNGPIAGSICGASLRFSITYPEGVVGTYTATVINNGNTLDKGLTTSSTGDTATWTAERIDCHSEMSAMQNDASTIFFCDFNENTLDRTSGTTGSASGCMFAPALFGAGIRCRPTQSEKAIARFPNSAALNISKGTVEALVFTDSATGDYMHIIDKSWLYGCTVYQGFLAVNFGSGWWYSSVEMPLKAWSYVCGSFDGKQIKLYLNGRLVASAEYAGFDGDSSYDLGIGNAAADSHNVPFKGVIDEVRISMSVRTDSEIAATWNVIQSKL
jgi:hypothetical protein